MTALNHTPKYLAANTSANDLAVSLHADSPRAINSAEWTQAMGFARQFCARVFRDGGMPADALKAYGVAPTAKATDWGKAVELIAESFCQQTSLQRAS